MSKNSRLLWTQKIAAGTGKSAASKAPSARGRAGTSKSSWTADAAAMKLGAQSKWRKKKSDDEVREIKGARVVGIVLGIDPSLRGTGLSTIESLPDGSMRYIESKTIKNPPTMTMPQCLARILSETRAMIERTHPVCAAIEQSVYVQNFRTAMILGSSRGAAIAAAAAAGLEVFEYPPLRIKQAVIGYGRASKEQVARSVASMVVGAPVLPLDEADASGAALTHIFTHKSFIRDSEILE